MAGTTSSTSGWAQYFSAQRLQDGLKKYGRTGVVVYLALSASVTAGFYVAIERNMDVEAMLGLQKGSSPEEEHRDPTLMERLLTGKGSHFALAYVCSKMLVPIKVPIALAITPHVYRWQQRLLMSAASKATKGGPGSV